MNIERRRRRRLTIFLRHAAFIRGNKDAVKVLRDPELFDEVFDRLAYQKDEEDRPVLDLLDWLIEHADEIMAIVAKIIEMFSGLSSLSAEQVEALGGCCGGDPGCKGADCNV